MSAQTVRSRSIRVAVFPSIAQADQAVDGLLKLGFSVDQITVICSDENTTQRFHACHHQDQAGSHTAAAAAVGGAIGATPPELIHAASPHAANQPRQTTSKTA